MFIGNGRFSQTDAAGRERWWRPFAGFKPLQHEELGRHKVRRKRIRKSKEQGVPDDTAPTRRLLTRSASDVLAALRGPTYGRDYASLFRLLRPCPRNGASMGEEAVLADSGRVGEVAAGVRWVKAAFLNSLRMILKESVSIRTSHLRHAQAVC